MKKLIIKIWDWILLKIYWPKPKNWNRKEPEKGGNNNGSAAGCSGVTGIGI